LSNWKNRSFVSRRIGCTFGDLYDRELQWPVLLDCFNAAQEITESGAILELPSRWTKDDLGEKQLLKHAH
jgi:hypothetical protein